jgi:DNA end-binding protein Ku
VRHKAVSFNQLDDRNMSRIRYRKVSEETGDEVPAEHIVKGVEISKGRYVLVEPEELEPFVPAASKEIVLEEFVDLVGIDPVFFETPYYLAPHLNPKPYVLLARALASTGKVAIARFVMRNRQYTAAIRADGNRLVMSTLAYADEVVPVVEVEDLDTLGGVDVSEREVTMAEMLVDSLTAAFDPDKYSDEYRVQVMDLIAKKANGEEFELPATAPRRRGWST